MENKDYKGWLIDELESWCHTFNSQYPLSLEEEERLETIAFEKIQILIDKYKKGKCDKQDYENILFHLWQIKAFS